ncbi:MAG: YfiR family protein [Terricaulis sp.]
MRVLSLLLAICTLALTLEPSASAQTSQEDVKATFIYRFASFVTWPAASFPESTTPVQVCVIGAEPLERALSHTTANQHVGARSFSVRRVADADDIGACHLLYVVGDRSEAALRAARRHSVLTITDGGDERGIIHFTVVDARVRFYIDDALAAEGGLSVDPRLLNLALSVRRRAVS